MDDGIEYRGKRSYSRLYVRISIAEVLKGQSIGVFSGEGKVLSRKGGVRVVPPTSWWNYSREI